MAQRTQQLVNLHDMLLSFDACTVHSPDYVASCCNEAGMRREALGGKIPRQWLVSTAHIACVIHKDKDRWG